MKHGEGGENDDEFLREGPCRASSVEMIARQTDECGAPRRMA